MTERLQDDGFAYEESSRHPMRASHPDHNPKAEEELSSSVAVRRHGPHAWVRVTGQVTPLARRHLDDWLDWLITTGAARVTVSLATADQIDDASLLVLRVAQSRLRGRNGELLVTAGRAQVRAALSWASANGCNVRRPRPSRRPPAS